MPNAYTSDFVVLPKLLISLWLPLVDSALKADWKSSGAIQGTEPANLVVVMLAIIPSSRSIRESPKSVSSGSPESDINTFACDG